MTQSDLLELVLKLAKDNKLALSSVSYDPNAECEIMSDGRGNLMCPHFYTSDVNLTMDFKMKRQAFLEISEMMAKIVRA